MLSTLNKSSGTLSPAEKADIINQHRNYHSELLAHYDIPEKDFNVKVVFNHKGNKVIGLFPGEFTKPKGFFLEFVDSNLQPKDPDNRIVYRMSPRQNYEELFELLPKGSYAVPLEELETVILPGSDKKVKMEFSIDIPKEENKQDDHFSNMTIRDLAAILWQSPVSDKRWLNELVVQENENKQNT